MILELVEKAESETARLAYGLVEDLELDARVLQPPDIEKEDELDVILVGRLTLKSGLERGHDDRLVRPATRLSAAIPKGLEDLSSREGSLRRTRNPPS